MILNTRGETFQFEFREDVAMWRILESPKLVEGHVVDLEIDLKNFQGDLNWQHIEMFIEFLFLEKNTLNRNIDRANTVLTAFYRVLYADLVKNMDFSKVYFSPSGFDYKGYKKQYPSSSLDHFYDIYMEVGSTADPDVFSYDSWKAHFIGNSFVGVSKN